MRQREKSINCVSNGEPNAIIDKDVIITIIRLMEWQVLKIAGHLVTSSRVSDPVGVVGSGHGSVLSDSIGWERFSAI